MADYPDWFCYPFYAEPPGWVADFIYVSLAITTLGITIANWTGSADTDGSGASGDAGLPGRGIEAVRPA